MNAAERPAAAQWGEDHRGQDHRGEDHRGQDHGGQDHRGEDHRGEDHRGQGFNRWRLAARLCRRFAGVALDDLYEVSEAQTPYGPCLHLVQLVQPFGFSLASPAAAEDAVLGELRLVCGVGPVTSEALRAGGVGRITDLVDHHRFGGSASWLVERWERRDLGVLHDHIRHCLGPLGHHPGVALAGLIAPGGLVIVDLETLGLWGSSMILFGFARLVGTCLELHQYLARAGSEEPAALHLAMGVLRECEGLVTYNGRSADAPWLAQRSAYFGLGKLPVRYHLDLLPPVRRLYRPSSLISADSAPAAGTGLEDCRLGTVEAHVLGTPRDLDDLPGEAVPHFYREYERSRNIGPLVPIIEHNRADLVAVARLLCLLSAAVPAPAPAVPSLDAPAPAVPVPASHPVRARDHVVNR
ncbi:MAG: ribonuclease H-like domain-containing protein [Acidimicrobiales bacterium]